MRPVDLAREHGLSAQAVRNYEDAGILPSAERSAAGYRRYTPVHAQALRAFLSLRRAHGFQGASEIMRAVGLGDMEFVYRAIDSAHAELQSERAAQSETADVLRTLSDTTLDAVVAEMTVGELARRLGLHAATLRTWESAGILQPERDRATGYRLYGPDVIRDAEIARQLRRGGYPLHQVARFLESLHDAGGTGALQSFVDAWQVRLTARGRNLLAGAAQLDRYLTLLNR